CLRCDAAAHEWQDLIAHGDAVVLFDTDLGREDRTSPGGLEMYGKLAALAAGRPRAFVDFYAVMRGVDIEPPDAGPLYDPGKVDFATYLVDALEAVAPTTVVWQFERPTQWERWFADRLVAAGGERRLYATPLSVAPGIRVRTAWSVREPVVA